MPDLDYQISIQHCLADDFLERFRGDLSAAHSDVIVLSPFLSKNRASHYYPAFAALSRRSVRVRVYARPKWEQPDSLKEHFEPVRLRLEGAGVDFYTRSGMHEKVGVIDGRVLWHGSLNPLSHNDTRESMLRIESAEVVREVLVALDLGAPDTDHWPSGETVAPRSETPGAGEGAPEAPRCPVCGSAVRYFAEAGVWVCSRAPACEGVLNQTKQGRSSPPAASSRTLDLDCPVCSHPFIVRAGLKDRVVCSNPSCGFSLDERLAGWILRAHKN